MEYRREIDGLRSLAILPIILFHAGLTFASGGFVGVDVFFVISGYLITSIIIAEQQKGSFSLLGFYERRMRRILPALFTMMLFSLPFAWLWLMPDDLKKFSTSVADVSLFISNITFLNQTGYFDTAAELKPLLHTWSLAVEEQYYLLFPVFLWKSWKIGRNKIIAIIATVAIISLFSAHWGAYNKPAGTFFLLPTRIWELLLGAITAFYLSSSNNRLNQSEILNKYASIIGFSLIIFSICTFNKQTPFPSLYALLPTIGAALIILFADSKTMVGKLLGSKPLVAIGLISYSAYLWHQPIFAFARYRSLEEPNEILVFTLIVSTLSIAYLSWKYVESPFRSTATVGRRQIFLFGALGSVLFIIIGLVGQLHKGWMQRFTIPPNVVQSMESTSLRTACDKNYDGKGWGIDFCSVGDTSKLPRVAVFGDSHSEAILPAFDAIGKKLGVNVVHLGLGGCPPLLGVDVLNGHFDFGVCKSLAERQYEYVKSNKINKVFLVSCWTLFTNGRYNGNELYYLGLNKHDQRSQETSRLLFEESFKRTIKAYSDIGTEVYVLAQVPRQLVSAPQLYYRIYADSFNVSQRDHLIKKLSVPTTLHNELQQFTKSIFCNTVDLKNENLIELDNIFCDENTCAIGRDDASFYHDNNHLSDVGAHLVINEIMKYMIN